MASRLVRSLQVHPCLDILRSLGLFDEINIYSIVIGYVTVKCTWAHVTESTTKLHDEHTSLIIDQVGAPAFDSHLSGVRFCFPSIPTFQSLGGALDIGVTKISAPRKNYITCHESEYFYIESSGGYGYATLFSNMPGVANVKCPIHHRVVYIDLVFGFSRDFLKKKMTIRVAHVKGKSSTNVKIMTQTIEFDRFLNSPLYPMLSSRRSLDVSIHALD